MTEAKWALDRSQLDRGLLGDLSALIGVLRYLESRGAQPHPALSKIETEIDALVKELWP